MVRTRLASLTLAGSFLLTSSGCFNLFERLQCWRSNSGAQQDCACMDATTGHGMVPTSVEGPVSGPILVNPDMGPPPGQPPIGPPPRIVPIPAQPMPWPGAN